MLCSSLLIPSILKEISGDIYCFAPGNEPLPKNVRKLQAAIDDFYYYSEKNESNKQSLYNIFATDYAAKAIGIIKKANLLFPGLLELFGKSQFLGEKESSHTIGFISFYNLQNREVKVKVTV